jgi:hypothetical protein
MGCLLLSTERELGKENPCNLGEEKLKEDGTKRQNREKDNLQEKEDTHNYKQLCITPDKLCVTAQTQPLVHELHE